MSPPEETDSVPVSLYRRVAWLLACVGVGALVGVVGSAFTGNAYWYVAIPALVAVGWLFLANPSECEPSAARRGRPQQGKHNRP